MIMWLPFLNLTEDELNQYTTDEFLVDLEKEMFDNEGENKNETLLNS